MNERGFESAADVLRRQVLGRRKRAQARLEVDLEGRVLTVELASEPRRVVDKHAPDREMWMASPACGASHLVGGLAEGRRVETWAGEALIHLLAPELAAAAGAVFDLG